MNIKSRILFRIYFVFAGIVLFGVLILGKAFHTQVERDGYWRNLADSLSTTLVSIEPERGNIYSADDRLLATSLPRFDLRVDFGSDAMSSQVFYENLDSLSILMNKTFGEKSQADYKMSFKKARDTKRRYYLLCKNVDYATVTMIKTWPLFRLGKYKGGLIVETIPTRKNPYGLLAERTIGYQRKNAQSIGLESQYNTYLQGSEGHKLMRRIAGGLYVPLSSENAIEPVNGFDIITTIDVSLQGVAESALEKAMYLNGAQYGCTIVMEVKTGAIKAIANLGLNKNKTYSENFNYAIANSSEPGSTFKLASYLALLEDGFVKLTDSVNISHGRGVVCGHLIKDDGKVFPQYRTILNAFAKSSNVAVARLTYKYYGGQREKFYEKFKQFGLTEPTYIEMKGEPKPTLSKPDVWSCESVPWKAHGYELKFTPLQLLLFYNTVANNGCRMKPYLVQKILDNGRVVKETQPQVLIQKISTDYALGEVKKMLINVVDTGTARKIKSPYYKIAGKTGTAELNEPGKGYSGKNQASFCGFFPAEEPKYSCIVVIVGPTGLFTHGGDVAAPVFKEISDKIMSSDPTMHKKANTYARKDSSGMIPPLFAGELSHVRTIAEAFGIKMPEMEDVEYVTGKLDIYNTQIIKTPFKEGIVPNVTGLSLDDALYLLENSGYRVAFSGKGKVLKQSIAPGSKVPKSSRIEIKLG